MSNKSRKNIDISKNSKAKSKSLKQTAYKQISFQILLSKFINKLRVFLNKKNVLRGKHNFLLKNKRGSASVD